MLEIQDNLNKKVNRDWRNAGYEWRDAITVEAVELFDHLNWKWWKTHKSDPDWGQVRMEAVDIWHFIMSEMLCDEEDSDFEGFFKSRSSTFFRYKPFDHEAVMQAARSMIAVASGDYGTIAMIHIFLGLLGEIGMSFNDLYRSYIGKAKLNELRWANGYGTDYIKIWNGLEDNQVLTSILNLFDVNDPLFGDKVEAELKSKYAQVKAAEEVKNGSAE